MAVGQYLSVQGAPFSIRAAAVFTASYVATSAVNLQSWTSATVFITVGTAAAETLSIKPQWSPDNTTWYDEMFEVIGTQSGTEQPFAAWSRVVTFSLDTGKPNYSCRFNRMAQYFRLACKSSGTTATAVITVQLSALSN
jgi:hypothetical protein